MRKRYSFWAITLSAVIALGGAAAYAKDADVKKTITCDGHERTYYVHLPPAYDGQTRLPLVLGLHGGGGTAKKFNKQTNVNDAADAYGFIVVYPQGLDRAWNDGREINPLKRKTDDVAFLSELCKHLAADYAVDADRIYCTGISNGAMMSFRMAAECPDLIAAACGVVGGVTEVLVADHPTRAPVPVMMIVGDEDPLVPFEGGDIKAFGIARGKILPQEEGARWWAEGNGASLEPSVTELPDADAGDNCRVVKKVYASATGDDVVLVTILGGGHTWPGGQQYLPERTVGRVCRDVGNEVIWEFFSSHPQK